MAPETAHHTIRSTTRTTPAPVAGTGVPLLALVLSGALRMRRDGEELDEPPADAA